MTIKPSQLVEAHGYMSRFPEEEHDAALAILLLAAEDGATLEEAVAVALEFIGDRTPGEALDAAGGESGDD